MNYEQIIWEDSNKITNLHRQKSILLLLTVFLTFLMGFSLLFSRDYGIIGLFFILSGLGFLFLTKLMINSFKEIYNIRFTNTCLYMNNKAFGSFKKFNYKDLEQIIVILGPRSSHYLNRTHIYLTIFRFKIKIITLMQEKTYSLIKIFSIRKYIRESNPYIELDEKLKREIAVFENKLKQLKQNFPNLIEIRDESISYGYRPKW